MRHNIKVLTATDRLAKNIISYETSCGIIGGKTIGEEVDFTDDDHPEAFFHVEKRLDALVQRNAPISVQTLPPKSATP